MAGFSVGAMERGTDLPSVVAGDVLLGLASDGVHSNGYSLVRKLVEKVGLGWDAPCPWAEGTWARLLTPTRLYVKAALRVESGGVHALAHITGGGLTENLPRVLPEGLGAEIDLDAGICRRVPVVGARGGMARRKCSRPLTSGIGMMLVCQSRPCGFGNGRAGRAGETVFPLGTSAKARACGTQARLCEPKRSRIFVSGGGSNMRALVER